jgi:ABC-type sugar transport system ATPase subunit
MIVPVEATGFLSKLENEGSAGTVMLTASGICKAYGGVQALKGVDFTLYAGEIHGLCGENGSGKSTLLKILSAQIPADDGTIFLGGRAVYFRSPIESLAAGVGTVTQERTLANDLTVGENVLLGHQKVRKWWGIDWPETRRRAKEILDAIECTVSVDTLVSDLAPGDKQMVEIARALSGDVRVLILDEPTSSLTAHESESLFRALRSLASKGVAIVFISHRTEEIFGLCDRLTVFRDGSLISTDRIGSYSEHRLVFDMMGREPTRLKSRIQQSSSTQDTLEVRALSVPRKFDDVSVNVSHGEIVGVIGLVGAGHSELLESIFGLHRERSGEILIDGVVVSIDSPRSAMRAGIGFVPADRKRHGLILDMTVFENAIMASTSNVSRLAPPRPAKAANYVAVRMKDFSIVAPSVDVPVSGLSGGNQQKVLLTKWLGTNPRLLLLDEPTRGVDVGAKQEIYRILLAEREKGLSILVSSSEVPELLTLCDRILVMHRGKVVANLNKEEADESLVVQYAMGQLV